MVSTCLGCNLASALGSPPELSDLVANLPGGFRLDLMRTSIHEHALEALRMDEAGFHEILDQINGRSGEIEFSLAA